MVPRPPMARLFLCDDDETYRSLLRAVLVEEDHDIVGEGCDGQDCIDRVPEARPDAVLLDLNMPRMDGYEALPQLRSAVPEAKIIVMSSARPEDVQHRVVSLGAHGFIEKPDDIFALGREVQALLDAA